MANYVAALGTGLNDQAGASASRHTLAGVGTSASTARPIPPTEIKGRELTVPLAGESYITDEYLVKKTPTLTFDSTIIPGPGIYWFDLIHSYPTLIELGNILSTVTEDIEVYSSYRDTSQSLLTATNNAGTGITFQNLPTLPAVLPPNGGRVFQVRVSTQGQPTIDGTLDFTTSVDPVSIAITGTRVVMMAFEPSGAIQETLEFVTDILRSANGKEQRIRVRNYPRQILDYNFLMPEEEERRKAEVFLYKWHPQVFGVPIWFESKRLTAAATAGDTTIYLDTAYSDFRVGSLLIVWSDFETFDALEISAVTATSITLSSALVYSHPIRSKVMPLRTGITKQEISGDKYPVNLHTFAMKFFITDNEVDIGDDSAFSFHNSKTMFDDPNWIPRETNTDTLKNVVHRIDNKVGSAIQFSDWDNSHFISSKGFFCRNPQATWEMRQILHALAGRQKSFYLPTFYEDMVINQNIVNGTSVMDIDNIGYTDFIGASEPNKSLYMVLNDGTIITRQVTGSTVIDSTTERLTVDSPWSQAINITDVRIISYLRLGRFANDRFVINHNNSGQSTLKATVQGVIQ